MNEGLKILGIAAGGVVMIACCVALSVGSVVVLGAISGLWAWLGGLDPALSAGVALVVAAVAYGLVRGRKWAGPRQGTERARLRHEHAQRPGENRSRLAEQRVF